MAEWLKAHAWRACGPHKGLEGSNPSLSVQVVPFTLKSFPAKPTVENPRIPRGWNFALSSFAQLSAVVRNELAAAGIRAPLLLSYQMSLLRPAVNCSPFD